MMMSERGVVKEKSLRVFSHCRRCRALAKSSNPLLSPHTTEWELQRKAHSMRSCACFHKNEQNYLKMCLMQF